MKIFRRNPIILALAVLLLSLAGCPAADRYDLPMDDPIDIGQTARQELPVAVQYIRTDGYVEGAAFPRVYIIRSPEALDQYYTANQSIFDLERKPQIYSDTTVGFLDACDRYDAAFFEENFLVFVLLQEGSGSIRHGVRCLEQTADKKLSMSIDRKVPEVGTDDMAQWHIILEVNGDVEVETPSDVRVYLDGNLAWNGSTVDPPRPEPAFRKPPEGTLITPEGDTGLTVAGYDWTYENPDGTAVAAITDQASRPLPAERLKPVTVSGKYAQTVYAYVPSTDKYEPTNSMGYFVKLAWEAMPTSVSYTCWPEAVWQNSSTTEEKVISYQDFCFYAKPGGYIYEIAATWENTGAGYYGRANYYVYIHGAEQP